MPRRDGEDLGKLRPGHVELTAFLSANEAWLKADPQVAARLRDVWLEGARGAREFFQSKAKQFFGLEARSTAWRPKAEVWRR